jgi:hypothetical protein
MAFPGLARTSPGGGRWAAMRKPGLSTLAAATLFVVALGASGCKGPINPSQNATSTCTGSVQPLSYGPICSFTVSNDGEYTVTASSLIPGQVYLGIGYGTFSAGTCTFLQQSPAGPSSVGTAAISGQITVTGSYCVQAFDPALAFGGYPTLTVPENYTIQISHP